MERQYSDVGQRAGPSAMAIGALVAGILSFFGPGALAGIPAWIMGAMNCGK